MKILIASIRINPRQPRKNFDGKKLQELAESIQERGVLEPLIVESEGDGTYTLVAGERRLRACKLIGKKFLTVGNEVIVRQKSNHNGREKLVNAFVENYQREDMTPMETARALHEMATIHKMKTHEIAQATGMHPSHVYQYLQMTKAEPEIQKLWEVRKISHETRAVTAILSLPPGVTRIEMAQKFADKRFTAKMIIAACKKYNEMHAEQIKNTKVKNATSAQQSVERLSSRRPEWDALFQLGRVPPFPLVNDVVMQTCDECPLRSMASNSVCGPCGLVAFLKRLEAEVVNVG